MEIIMIYKENVKGVRLFVRKKGFSGKGECKEFWKRLKFNIYILKIIKD